MVMLLTVALPASAQEGGGDPQVHVVERGETLYRIARENGLTVPELQRLNGLEGTTIRVGQRLIVGYDRREGEELAAERSEMTVDRPVYTARPGDTFYSIAARYGVSADTLYVLNDRQTAPLGAGQPVYLPAAFGPTIHTVEAGQTLHSIAGRYETSVDDLQSINRLSGDTVRIGQQLRIPARRTPPPRAPGAVPSPDTLGAIARYPATFAGRLTASGAAYEPGRYVVSHPDLPFGTVVLLTNPANGRRTFAIVQDRGPLDPSYLLDISAAVAEALGVEEREEGIQVHVVK